MGASAFEQGLSLAKKNRDRRLRVAAGMTTRNAPCKKPKKKSPLQMPTALNHRTTAVTSPLQPTFRKAQPRLPSGGECFL